MNNEILEEFVCQPKPPLRGPYELDVSIGNPVDVVEQDIHILDVPGPFHLIQNALCIYIFCLKQNEMIAG